MAQVERGQSRPRRAGVFGAFSVTCVLCHAEGIFPKDIGVSRAGI